MLFLLMTEKKNDSEKDICSLTGVRYIKPIERYTRSYYFEGSPAKYEKSLAFIQIFLFEILPSSIYPTIMVISRDGEFYKKDNKFEFEKVLNYLGLLDKKFAVILNMIAGNGFLEEKLVQANREDDDLKRITISDAIVHIDSEVLSLLEGFITHLRMLNKVMHGIVIGDGGAYDTLSNISSIGGKSNIELKESFRVISTLINKMVKYIAEMKILEEKKL